MERSAGRRAARRILSAEAVGPVADVARAEPVDVPSDLAPWQLARVSVQAHPRGGRVMVDGEGACDPAWAAANTPLHGVAVGGASGCRLVASAGGPVGTWEVRSAGGWGRVLGARGVVFVLRATGAVEIVLADAFVGGAEELPVAERMGSSGVASTRWRVTGPQQLVFFDVRTEGVTLHGRGGPSPAFAVPGISGVSAGLHALSEAPWDWRVREDGRLVLDGRISGGPISLVLSQPDVDA